ncbi:hypothetical protein [Vibrio tubiashii]|uniref:hypothetical protein n=1 Tax=Vibrio tubiashii TaxID=29498 RepID=UPI00349EB236
MKKFFLIIGLIASQPAMAIEWTEARLVDNIQIDGTGGIYYFKSLEGWGAPGCPNAAFIFYRKHQVPASEGMLSVILASQATNRPIKARGVCTDSHHFQLEYIVQERAR